MGTKYRVDRNDSRTYVVNAQLEEMVGPLPPRVGRWFVDPTWPMTRVRIVNDETGEAVDFGPNDSRGENLARAQAERTRRNKH